MGIVPWVARSTNDSHPATRPDDALVVTDNSNAQNPASTLTNAASAQQAPLEVTQIITTEAQSTGASIATEEQSGDALTTDSSGDFVDFMQTPLVEIPFRGKRCTQLGNRDALLLILVEANSTQQTQYPFEPADAKLFDDMLRAIAWRRQDVCLGVLPPVSAPSLFVDSNTPLVSDLCKPHRDAVLLFRQSVPDTHDTDDLLVPLARADMLAWQLPHPALLRDSPERKRQAWHVLKAARARLG